MERDQREERERKLEQLEYQRKIEEEKRKGEKLIEMVKQLRNEIY